MNAVQKVIAAGYWAIVILFVVCAFALIGFAVLELRVGLNPRGSVPLTKRFDAILESIVLLTIAGASLELGQTILEEEIRRSTHLSAPTRVRRFLSRFKIVVIVALSVECLVTAFQASHNHPSHLPFAAAIGFAASDLLAAWGLFVKRVVLWHECHARLFPNRAPQWVKRGQYPEIPVLDRHGRSPCLGRRTFTRRRMFHHLARSLSVAEQLLLLVRIAAAYSDDRVQLVWDNGPTHRNRQVTWLARHARIVCFWPPPYRGADVIPNEHCWRWFREHATHNHLFQTLDELVGAARQFFRDVASSNTAALTRSVECV